MPLVSNEKYSLIYRRINLIYQKPEVKASLEVILSVFTVTVLIFAAIRPTLTNIASLQKKIEDLNSFNIKADNKIAQVFNAQTELNKFKDKLSLFDAAVPSQFSYYDMAGRIEYLAQNKGLTVQTVSMPGTKLFGTGKASGEWSRKLSIKDTNNIVQLNVSFAVSGDPANVKSFLMEIENMDRLSYLSSVVLTSEPGMVQGTSTLKASGQIYFYFYQQT